MTLFVSLLVFTPLALISSWAFAAMMKTLAGRRKWDPRKTFWVSYILYAIVGFIIPYTSILSGYSDFLYYLLLAFQGATPVWLSLNALLKSRERQGSLVAKPGTDASQPPTPVAQGDQTARSVAPVVQIRPTAGELFSSKFEPGLGKAEVPPQAKVTHIFISYRRSDSADVTGRMYDRLTAKFGRDAIFKDVDSIPLGLDFKEYLDKQVGECGVLLAVIGDRWLEASDPSGKTRLDDPSDFVRIEIESALGRDVPVIPLLVREAKMPREDQLPPSLRKLVYRNGTPIRSDPDFHRDMDRLIAALEKYVK